MRRRRKNHILVPIIGLGLFIFLLYILLSAFFLDEERKAKNIVANFYDYESTANYGRSWELLHSSMQARFARGAYAQDRAHVFNGHFGADTFSYDVGEPIELSDWRFEKDGEAFDTAYKFEVRQEYHGKYGHFLFVQYVYVVQEEDEWRIVWDYKE
ncbi:hypothetical protein [Bacillus sp. RO1]|uniref:hypothetical protein n=1 Tax=Bacillus sp. RO1 TaxID=2722703 RepID=UPI0014563F35|nr:hypothetical protein [Bacillus sp. RO1]NLP51833.1 hypothetical protein [Bacillus sp. RO1]